MIYGVEYNNGNIGWITIILSVVSFILPPSWRIGFRVIYLLIILLFTPSALVTALVKMVVVHF